MITNTVLKVFMVMEDSDALLEICGLLAPPFSFTSTHPSSSLV